MANVTSKGRLLLGALCLALCPPIPARAEGVKFSGKGNILLAYGLSKDDGFLLEENLALTLEARTEEWLNENAAAFAEQSVWHEQLGHPLASNRSRTSG